MEVKPADFSFQFQSDEVKGGKTRTISSACTSTNPEGDAAQSFAGGKNPGHRPNDALQQAAPLRVTVKPIHLIPLANGSGPLEPGLDMLEHLAANLARTFKTPCRIRRRRSIFRSRWMRGGINTTRRQLLQRLERKSDPDARILGVTALRPLRSGAHLRVWRSAVGRQLRSGIDGAARRRVLRASGAGGIDA